MVVQAKATGASPRCAAVPAGGATMVGLSLPGGPRRIVTASLKLVGPPSTPDGMPGVAGEKQALESSGNPQVAYAPCERDGLPQAAVPGKEADESAPEDLASEAHPRRPAKGRSSEKWG